MRTTLEIPETLLEEARKAARLSTKRETVVAGLNELLRKAKREDLRRLAGRVDLKIDLRKSRQRPS
jgi:Arc/MetJ family transcription regulator